MKEPRFSFVFCDDVRIEQGGRRSLMGCFTSAVQLKEPEVDGLSICCLVSAPVSVDLSNYRVWVRMSVDGKKEEEIDFPMLPSHRAEPAKASPALDFVRSLAPEIANSRRLVGLLKMEGRICFRKYLKFTTFVDKKEFDQALFFSMPAGSPKANRAAKVSATKKASRASRSSAK